jgi:hypothetical protein
MTAFDFLLSLECRGVKLKPSQGKLMVDAPAGILTDRDRTMLARYKADLLALLVIPSSPADLPLDWRERWEERAAIMEYEGGLPRERAEALALAEISSQMHEQEKRLPTISNAPSHNCGRPPRT